MLIKSVVLTIFVTSYTLKALIFAENPKSNCTFKETTFNTSLLQHFNKKFNIIFDQCDDLGPFKNVCTLARTELLPILNKLLKTEKPKLDPVQIVIGNDLKCLIRNRKYSEYFYVAGDWLKQYSIDERLALTWLPGWFDDESLWSIELVRRDKELQYRIKSTKLGEYLYGARNNWHANLPEFRYVFTWKNRGNICEDQCLWSFNSIANKNKLYFAIQNVESREYLYASNDLTYETNSRYVFTKKYDSLKEVTSDYEAQWIIECK